MIVERPRVASLATSLALRSIGLQFTRDGEQTASPKIGLLLTRDLQLQAVFVGSHLASNLFLASAVDKDWLLQVVDFAEPPLSVARYLRVNQDMSLAIDINDGSGGGAGGTPATLDAIVKVGGLLAERTVVAVEQQSDGVWRVAGSGRTDAQGELGLELRVTPSGQLYALGLDDWGIPYQADLIVAEGVVIRPSQFLGWLYRVTQAGQLPATEPEWWAAEGDNASRPLGTARAVAVRYYQPIGHGPLTPEVI